MVNLHRPDEYENEIWYDMGSHDFCHINIRDDGVIELINPENGSVYHKFDTEEQFDPDEYYQVPQKAAKNPAEYLQEYITQLRDEFLQTSDLQLREEIGIEYADNKTVICEQ